MKNIFLTCLVCIVALGCSLGVEAQAKDTLINNNTQLRSYKKSSVTFDSVRRVYRLKTNSSHSLRFVKDTFTYQRKIYDSIRKAYSSKNKTFRVYSDSLYRKKNYLRFRSDSLKKIIYTNKIRYDSLKMKTYLKINNKINEKISVQSNNQRSKEITMELPYHSEKKLFIINAYQKINVVPIKENKIRIKIMVNVNVDDSAKDDATLFKQIGIGLASDQEKIILTASGRLQNSSSYYQQPIDTARRSIT